MRSVSQPIGRERTSIGVGSDAVAARSDLRNGQKLRDAYDSYADIDIL
jgi:hypothetical protein